MDLSELKNLRFKFEKIFSKETAHPNSLGLEKYTTLSTGHCAVVAAFIHKRYGGYMFSACEKGISHWFNRIDGWYIDLTGDQFGYPPIRVWHFSWPPSHNKKIYKWRFMDHLDKETLARLDLFTQKFNALND
jgi:hypothetical protein